MNVSSLLYEIDAEISRLMQARALLSGEEVKRSPGRPKGTTVATTGKKKRNLTPEGRARIAEAVKARWAKQKKSAK